jgi:hypothetical protein
LIVEEQVAVGGLIRRDSELGAAIVDLLAIYAH